jgi:two-component system response regulator BaeR
VKAVLRRSGPDGHGGHGGHDGTSPWVFDDVARRASVHGQPLALTSTEYTMLAAMARRPGAIFTRAQLLELVGGDNLESSDRAIDSHVKNLRRKLAAVRPGVELIHSVYGLGYRFEI